MADLESRIREIGEELFAHMAGNAPGLFDKAWWTGQVLEWAMRDPGFKTEMFRFVDVFPVLDTPEHVGAHIREYLLRPGLSVPTAIKLALKSANLAKVGMRVAAGQIAKNLEGMAHSFIVGTDAESALPKLEAMRAQQLGFTVDLLGEATVSEVEADVYVQRYAALIDGLAARTADWPEDARLDRDDHGQIPRVNVSVKVSAMHSQLDPLDFDASVEAAADRLIPLFERARDRKVFVNLDLEDYRLKDLTLAVFRRVVTDPRLAGFEHMGVVIQAYLRDAEHDLEALIKWARKTAKRRITVRLVKGAYWDYETVRAQQKGWASPVWLDKGATDACFERCAALLLRHHKHVRTALASHNVRSLAHAMAVAERHKVPIDAFEVQCLFGMAEPIKAACVARGHRVRVYAPIGELIPGMAYLVRRLLENTSNEGWLRQGFAEGAPLDALLAAPVETDRDHLLRPMPSKRTDPDAPGPFVNEPLRDVRRAEARAQLAKAVQRAHTQLGRTYGPVIDGKRVETGHLLTSVDPADGETVIGTVHLARLGETDAAIAAAQAAWPAWRDTPWRDRAAAVFRLAALMRAERDALAALMVREVGKPWREADGDVCEAIDFCEFYGREALRLGAGQTLQAEMPGETNRLTYRPRGVAAVIAPWNFPLAIPVGMVVAALVTGNTVILKPAEQSMVIAARFVALAHQAGVPVGALHALPGFGEVVGARLVSHPAVHTIAFTGSKAVGLEIWRQAGVTHPGQRALKRVVCEMGGKNAIIVDDDADVDEAVAGVVHSAFGFAGQKCSACGRVIVVGGVYDRFVGRLVEAVRSLRVGAPVDPGVALGPVIDRESHDRLREAIERGAETARLLVGGELTGPGYFVAPTVFGDVLPSDPLATDELFGPVLAVLRVPDFDAAIALANATDYALTGGLFSRTPSHLERARTALVVGNLYLNRAITGAIVGRQPFGGSGMSGGGTKAGGPDYLLSFVDPQTTTENTLRRGFAPEG